MQLSCSCVPSLKPQVASAEEEGRIVTCSKYCSGMGSTLLAGHRRM